MRLAPFLYGLALLAFPRTIRRAHRAEMFAAFEETLRDAAPAGTMALVATALRCYGEIVAAGLADRAATLGRDLRYAARTLGKTPVFTTIVVATFALAIGATAAVYAVVDGVMLRPLPWTDPDRLVALNQRLTMGGTAMCERCTFRRADLEQWKRTSRTLLRIGEFDPVPRVLGGATPVRVPAAEVDEDYFAVLGAAPLLGRFFTAADRAPGAAPVAVVAWPTWRGRFGGDPRIVGARVRLDGKLTALVGVAPPGFADPTPQGLRGDGSAFWTPLARPASEPTTLAARHVGAFARVRSGAEPAAVRADVQLLIERDRARSRNLLRPTAVVVPVRERLLGDVRPTMLIALAAVLVVLAVACANVASLLLARGATRRREIAIRAALGAGRSRIVTQLLTETLALAALGAALGVTAAAFALRALVALHPRDLPRIESVGLDPRVLAAVAGITVLAAVVAGLVPALELVRGDLDEALKGGERGGADRRGDRAREGFVAAQIALALAVVVLGGLVMRSVVAYAHVDPGFRPDGLYVASGDYPLRAAPAAAAAAQERLRAAVAALPGVESATISDNVPLEGFNTQTFTVEGRRAVSPLGDVLSVNAIDGAYFHTLGMPVRQGREIDPRARPGREAVVSAAFVRRYFPRGGALGAHVFDGTARDAASTHTVVGIVADVPLHGLVDVPAPAIYLRTHAGTFSSFNLTLRSALPPATVRRELDAAWLATLGPAQLPVRFESMADLVARESARVRMVGTFLAALGAVALALAVTGLYGVMTFSVARRTREIGIRMALGAPPSRVLRMVLRRGAGLAATGVVAGVAVALVLARSVQTFLYQVTTTDPATYGAVAGVLIAVALIASYVPARRATKVDPLRALRYE